MIGLLSMDALPFDRFGSPWMLLLLAGVPVAVLVAWARSRRSRVLYPGAGLARHAGTSVRARLIHLPLLIRALALASLVVALARPQDVQGLVRTTTEGIAMQLVIDRSRSMTEGIEIDGARTTRLEAVKQIAQEFIAGNGDDLPGRAGDMIGVIAFGSFADTISPLAREHAALLELVRDVDISPLQADQGTAIGEAVALAAARLREAEQEIARGLGDKASRDREADEKPDFAIKSKAIVLLTDGRNNRGEIGPIAAADLCKQWGITLYTIGIGGGSVEIRGFLVPTGGSIDKRTMTEMAEMTGGRFFMADNADSLREIYGVIDELETTEIETSESVDYTERFVPFAAAGLALLAFESLLSSTWLRRSL